MAVREVMSVVEIRSQDFRGSWVRLGNAAAVPLGDLLRSQRGQLRGFPRRVRGFTGKSLLSDQSAGHAQFHQAAPTSVKCRPMPTARPGTISRGAPGDMAIGTPGC